MSEMKEDEVKLSFELLRQLKHKDKLLAKSKELLQIQGANGNWNYDDYMHGLYNGMEMILSCLEEREPEFREAPKEWLWNKTVQSTTPTTTKGLE